MSGFQITEVRIENFRSLVDIWLPLRKQVILIGENNSGKTSLLEAMGLLFNESDSRYSMEDVFLRPDETELPQDRKIRIDVRIEPSGEQIEFDDEFNNLFGDSIQVGKGAEKSYVAVRAEYGWDKEEYRRSRHFLKGWARNNKEAAQLQVLSRPTLRRELLELFPFYYLDAKRDIQDQLHSRQSFWGKLAVDLQLKDETQKSIKAALQDLSELIRAESPVLAHIRQRLEELYRTVASNQEAIEISPLPHRINDLVRSMDILFKTKDAHSFSINRHGMGTRSMAALLVFRAFIDWKRQSNTGVQSLPIVALEEPEAHLHPHAQRALFAQIAEINGQKLISTHSPHVVSHAELFDFVLFRKNGSETRVTWLPEKSQDGSAFLNPGNAHKLHRFVQIQNSELFFSRAIVLFEGETEQYALPIFAEAYFGRKPDSLGISFVPVTGAGNYDSFLKIAEKLRMPWVILADSEPKVLKQLGKCFQDAELSQADFHTQIILLPDGHDFESYLIACGYGQEVEALIAEHFGENALMNFKSKRQQQPGNVFDYTGQEGHKKALNDFIDDRHHHGKSFWGHYFAEKIIATRTADDRVPQKLRELFTKVDELCKQVY